MQLDFSHININRDDIEFSVNDAISPSVEQTDINYQDMDTRGFINKTLLDAVKAGASDVQLEPYENEFRIAAAMSKTEIVARPSCKNPSGYRG